MAGKKGRFKIRGMDGKIRTYGGCQSTSQAVKKFIILAGAPEGYTGKVWRQGDDENKRGFRVTARKIKEAKGDVRLKKRYLLDDDK